jgi:sodium/proline symporter
MLMVTTFVLIWACIDLQLLSGSVPEELSTDILVPFSAWNPMNIVAFFLVWSLCAVGFGLSQPHVVARYFAEKNPDETRKARWVYILFLQYTWIGMTVFGVLASGLVKEIEDEELALPTYVMGRFAAPVVAFVMAGVFSAVASTLDSIFLAVGNILSVDVLPCLFGERRTFRENWFHRTASLAVAVIVIMCSMYTTEGVFYLTARSVTITTATIAPAMLLRVLCPGVGGRTLTSCILVGLAVGVIGLWLDWGAATVFGIESVAAFTAATVVGLILRRHATRSGGEAK